MATPPKSEKDKWVENIKALLYSVDRDYIQSCSISVVPESLQKQNHDIYMPRVVSIGPRFKDSREELLLMEEVKLRCMLSVLHRGKHTADADKTLDKCSSAVWELDEEVRASYVQKIELKQPELAKIMLLDGCFLLELLISKGLGSKFPSRLYPPCPTAEVLKDEDVLSDLMLFENQIPILVLHKLSQTIFPEVFEPDVVEMIESEEEKRKRKKRAKKINNLALSVLGYSSLEEPSFESPHFLDLVHFFENRTIQRGVESGDNLKICMPDSNHEKLKLKSCGLRLRAAGVSIQVIEDNKHRRISCFGWMRNFLGGGFIKLGNMLVVTNEIDKQVDESVARGFDFDFKFNNNNGKLEISELHITKTTKAKWRNLIAWEHHKYNAKSSRTKDHKPISTCGKFTSAALIFDGLICCEADMNFLKKKIIVDHTKMSNDELKEFFRTMSFGVDPGVVDSSYVTMVDELNNYSSKAFFIFFGIFKLLWHLFTIRLEWLVKFLKRNYNFVALLILLFGFVRSFHSNVLPLVQYITKLLDE